VEQRTIKDLRVLVTGGSSGLGRALVKELASVGAKVVTFARGQDALKDLKTEIPGVSVFKADISRKEDIHRISALAFQALGSVDVLIHNASYLGHTPLKTLLDTDCEDFERVWQANVLGAFRLSKAILPGMITSGRGLVVHISSDAAVNAYSNWGSYSVSKAAGDHLARIWQEELEIHGIRFLCVDPGDLNTPMHAAAVPGVRPEDLKNPKLAAQQLLAILEGGKGRVKL